MIGMNIADIGKYDFSSSKFRIAFDFLQKTALEDLPEGRIELGEGVYCTVSNYCTLPASERRFETHEKYFDIQCIIRGQESIALANRKLLTPATGYDAEKDVTFYNEPEFSGSVGLGAGDFLIVTPEDAHKPHCDFGGEHEVKKLVFKIPV